MNEISYINIDKQHNNLNLAHLKSKQPMNLILISHHKPQKHYSVARPFFYRKPEVIRLPCSSVRMSHLVLHASPARINSGERISRGGSHFAWEIYRSTTPRGEFYVVAWLISPLCVYGFPVFGGDVYTLLFFLSFRGGWDPYFDWLRVGIRDRILTCLYF